MSENSGFLMKQRKNPSNSRDSGVCLPLLKKRAKSYTRPQSHITVGGSQPVQAYVSVLALQLKYLLAHLTDLWTPQQITRQLCYFKYLQMLISLFVSSAIITFLTLRCLQKSPSKKPQLNLKTFNQQHS